MTTQEIVDALGGGKRVGDSTWLVCCPAHDDRTPSLSITDDNGKTLLCCHAGCANETIINELKARGLWSGSYVKPETSRPLPPLPPPPPQAWQPIMPVPDHAREEARTLCEGASGRYAYRDEDGDLLFVIRRYDTPDGKRMAPLTYGTLGGKTGWHRKSPPAPRPLFRLDRLAANPAAMACWVEGEKCVLAGEAAAEKAGRDWVFFTNPNGTGGVKHTDWSPLAGKRVLVIRDYDEPGLKAEKQITDILFALGCEVKVVNLDGNDLPQGWDIADALAGGWEPVELFRWIVLRAVVPQHIEPLIEEEQPPPPDDPYGNTNGHVQPFRVLGYSDGTYFYLGNGAGQVTGLTPGNHTAPYLNTLAPLGYWGEAYPSKTGPNYSIARDVLMDAAHRIGVYSPDRIRGRGVWWDDGRVVVHLGDHLLVDGERAGLADIESRYVYNAGVRLMMPEREPMDETESRNVLLAAKRFHWAKPVDAYLIAGWAALAPVCGALQWRPHILVTGAKGSGKSSIMDAYLLPLRGDMGFFFEGGCSEAGIRQKLKCDALPVLFDEADAESRAGQERIQSVLELMRAASTETGGQLVKGTAGGQAQTFLLRGMFCLASIAVNIRQHSDLSRIAVLQLLKPGGSDRTEWDETRRILTRFNTDYARRLLARTLRLIPTIRTNAETFAKAILLQHNNDRRSGDQFGTLIAGAWSLFSDAEITPDHAEEWVSKQQWGDHADAAHMRAEDDLLAFLMEYHTDAEGIRARLKCTLGDLVNRIVGRDDGLGVSETEAARVLRRHGMAVVEGKRALAVANRNWTLRRILAGTSWASDWQRVLIRIDGAQSYKPMHWAGHGTSRATVIPMGHVLEYTGADLD